MYGTITDREEWTKDKLEKFKNFKLTEVLSKCKLGTMTLPKYAYDFHLIFEDPLSSTMKAGIAHAHLL